MFDLEKSVHAWKRNLQRQETLEDGTIADLEAHLRDTIDALKREGKSKEEAFLEAAARVGEAKSLASECGKVREYRLDLRRPWRPTRFMPALLGNYLKVALRKIRRQKGYSVINIAGLALGITCVLLILSFVRYELGYDRLYPDADRIFRVVQTCDLEPIIGDWAKTSSFLAPALRNEYPEVEASARICRTNENCYFQAGDKGFKEGRVFFADPGVFDVFSLPLVSGDPGSALREPHTVIISQSTSRKYFGDADPVGKTLLQTVPDAAFHRGSSQTFRITGVFRDIPPQTHIRPELICSWASMWGESESWHPLDLIAMTYVKLRKGAAPRELESKIPAFVARNMGPSKLIFAGGVPSNIGEKVNARTLAERKPFKFFLQPVTSIHLYSHRQREAEPNGDIKDVLIFTMIAALILILACVNFINLTTARYGTRAREVGIRKTTGAPRSRLILQFLTETGTVTSLAFALALAAAGLLLPLFGDLAGRPLKLDIWTTPLLFAGIPVLILLITLIAGSYPAFLLSSLRPVTVLKGNFQHGPRGRGLRRGLVVFQFTASLILTLVTLAIFKQVRFIHTSKLGFDREQVLLVHNTYLLGPSVAAFKESLSGSPDIASASVSSFLPVTSYRALIGIRLEGKTEVVAVEPFFVDEGYIDTMGMEIVRGRDFSREFISDPNELRNEFNPGGRVPGFLPAVINETAARRFGWPEPLGKRFEYQQNSYTIVGVVRDFNYSSFRQAIEPLVFLPQRTFNFVSVRLRAKDPGTAIGFIRARWKEFAKDIPLEFSFMDDQFEAMYRVEQRSGQLYGIFAGLSIVIGALGLFGLASFMAEKRTKEIGVRKVLGATVWDVVALVSREFLLLVGLANLIAWPVAYFFMKKWLEGFAYRTRLGAEVFLAAGLMSLVVSILTVVGQSLKAALANPVDSLRYE